MNTEQENTERERASRSGWHYLFDFISAAVAGAVWCAIHLPLYALRKSLTPPDTFLFGGTLVGNIFVYMIPLFPAFALSTIPGRFLVRLIPAARVALEPELGDDTKTTYQLVRRAKWGVITLAAALPLCFTGAVSLWATSPKLIKVRPIFSATVHSYDWSGVRKVETGCTTARFTNFHFILDLADGTRIDLLEDDSSSFMEAYPKIQLALEGRSYSFSNAGLMSESCLSRLGPRWRKMLTLPPTNGSD